MIDWRKELRSFWHGYLWWMKLGLCAVPFGVLYGLVVRHLRHESVPALITLVVAALIFASRIIGMPPNE